MKKIAIIIYGPPGSGKGTQANLLANKFNLIHFDTGKFFEPIVHDPERQKDKIISRERKFFDTGKLMTPSFVLREVSRAVRRINKADMGVIFSGSPRTVYETDGLIPLLERLYGKENIFVFEFQLRARHSIKRNSARLLCSVCGYGLLTAYYPKVKPKYCPVCGGKFYKRTLDKPGIIKVRLKEYETRTKPIFGIWTERGYLINQIDARPAPYKVLRKITSSILKGRVKSAARGEKIVLA